MKNIEKLRDLKKGCGIRSTIYFLFDCYYSNLTNWHTFSTVYNQGLNRSSVAQTAEWATQNCKVPFQSPPGSNEILFLNITHNDSYISMKNNHEPNIIIVCEALIGSGCRALYYACRAWVKPGFMGHRTNFLNITD